MYSLTYRGRQLIAFSLIDYDENDDQNYDYEDETAVAEAGADYLDDKFAGASAVDALGSKDGSSVHTHDKNHEEKDPIENDDEYLTYTVKDKSNPGTSEKKNIKENLVINSGVPKINDKIRSTNPLNDIGKEGHKAMGDKQQTAYKQTKKNVDKNQNDNYLTYTFNEQESEYSGSTDDEYTEDESEYDPLHQKDYETFIVQDQDQKTNLNNKSVKKELVVKSEDSDNTLDNHGEDRHFEDNTEEYSEQTFNRNIQPEGNEEYIVSLEWNGSRLPKKEEISPVGFLQDLEEEVEASNAKLGENLKNENEFMSDERYGQNVSRERNQVNQGDNYKEYIAYKTQPVQLDNNEYEADNEDTGNQEYTIDNAENLANDIDKVDHFLANEDVLPSVEKEYESNVNEEGNQLISVETKNSAYVEYLADKEHESNDKEHVYQLNQIDNGIEYNAYEGSIEFSTSKIDAKEYNSNEYEIEIQESQIDNDTEIFAYDEYIANENELSSDKDQHDEKFNNDASTIRFYEYIPDEGNHSDHYKYELTGNENLKENQIDNHKEYFTIDDKGGTSNVVYLETDGRANEGNTGQLYTSEYGTNDDVEYTTFVTSIKISEDTAHDNRYDNLEDNENKNNSFDDAKYNEGEGGEGSLNNRDQYIENGDETNDTPHYNDKNEINNYEYNGMGNDDSQVNSDDKDIDITTISFINDQYAEPSNPNNETKFHNRANHKENELKNEKQNDDMKAKDEDNNEIIVNNDDQDKSVYEEDSNQEYFTNYPYIETKYNKTIENVNESPGIEDYTENELIYEENTHDQTTHKENQAGDKPLPDEDLSTQPSSTDQNKNIKPPLNNESYPGENEVQDTSIRENQDGHIAMQYRDESDDAPLDNESYPDKNELSFEEKNEDQIKHRKNRNREKEVITQYIEENTEDQKEVSTQSSSTDLHDETDKRIDDAYLDNEAYPDEQLEITQDRTTHRQNLDGDIPLHDEDFSTQSSSSDQYFDSHNEASLDKEAFLDKNDLIYDENTEDQNTGDKPLQNKDASSQYSSTDQYIESYKDDDAPLDNEDYPNENELVYEDSTEDQNTTVVKALQNENAKTQFSSTEQYFETDNKYVDAPLYNEAYQNGNELIYGGNNDNEDYPNESVLIYGENTKAQNIEVKTLQNKNARTQFSSTTDQYIKTETKYVDAVPLQDVSTQSSTNEIDDTTFNNKDYPDELDHGSVMENGINNENQEGDRSIKNEENYKEPLRNGNADLKDEDYNKENDDSQGIMDADDIHNRNNKLEDNAKDAPTILEEYEVVGDESANKDEISDRETEIKSNYEEEEKVLEKISDSLESNNPNKNDFVYESHEEHNEKDDYLEDLNESGQAYDGLKLQSVETIIEDVPNTNHHYPKSKDDVYQNNFLDDIVESNYKKERENKKVDQTNKNNTSSKSYEISEQYATHGYDNSEELEKILASEGLEEYYGDSDNEESNSRQKENDRKQFKFQNINPEKAKEEGITYKDFGNVVDDISEKIKILDNHLKPYQQPKQQKLRQTKKDSFDKDDHIHDKSIEESPAMRTTNQIIGQLNEMIR